MILYDVDEWAKAQEGAYTMAQEYYYDAWWFTLGLTGSSVALQPQETVVQYMAVEDPGARGQYENWSCVGEYDRLDGMHYQVQVFNYDYGSMVLNNNEVERNGDNVKYQTLYHPDYARYGPWHLAATLNWY